jgi:probable O-glycosylation ligase (exosortase A-associated)
MVVLAFLIVNIMNSEKNLKDMAIVLISLITFLVIYAYYRYKTEGFDYAIPSAYYVDRNFFAESIVSILPLAFIFYEETISKGRKILFLGIVAMMAVGVILTYSRGGLLALFIVFGALFLISKKKVPMILMVLLMLILFMPHIGEKYRGRMGTVTTYEKDPSAMIRIATWQAGISMVKQNPWLGIGPANFNDLFISYVPPELGNFADYTMSIHNIFLQVFSETGLIGGGIFVLIIDSSMLGIIRINIKNSHLAKDKRVNLSIPNALGVSLLGFCGAGFFLPGAYYGYLYIIIPMLVASKITYEGLINKAEV